LARIFVFYHFFNPDPVVSAVLLSELSAELVESGWEVTAFPSNRGSSEPSKEYPSSEQWNGVQIQRVSRPPLQQAKASGRLLNALWMLAAWSFRAVCTRQSPDAILIGTDPIFSVAIAPVWRLFHPRTKIVHWCFDLYPEAAYADGILPKNSVLDSIFTALMKKSYRACDLVVDIGACMRRLLHTYNPTMHSATIPPWALSEPRHVLPTAAVERSVLFGERQLALMYSGSFGRAHSFEDMLELMRHLRDSPSIGLVVSTSTNVDSTFRAAITSDDDNIRFVDLAPKGQMEQRLAAADIHVISLRKNWTGTVVPSKFFGALAVGRPVLFCGSRDSSLAALIEEFQIGWVLEPGNAAEVAKSMRAVLNDLASMEAMRERCHQVYQDNFSRAAAIGQWKTRLQEVLTRTDLA